MSFTKFLHFFLKTTHYLYKSQKPQASIPDLQMNWSHEVLKNFNISLASQGEVSSQSPMIFVGNHISYMDIPVLMSAIRQVSFVAKKEISLWPVIGSAARAMKTIFVERDSRTSRLKAREAIREGLRQNGRIVVFPSGTTSLDENKAWRLGAFEIAKEMGVLIQPFRLQYDPLRASAFIDDDIFTTHLLKLTSLKKINAKIDFHTPINVEDPMSLSQELQMWSQKSF